MPERPAYTMIEVDEQGAVGVIRLNRPRAHNALCKTLLVELGQALSDFERRALGSPEEVGAVVITGGERVFAAGADINEMAGRSQASLFADDYPAVLDEGFERLERCRLPLIAAVAGMALGGGCELAMACDTIVAGRSAVFGQPEVRLGTMPGAGGTQRLVRAIGKAKAMDLCLTGRKMGADEAERLGLVSRLVEDESVLDEAIALAAVIAGHSRPAVLKIREAVNQSFETGLAAGLRFERRAFQSTFGFDDCREGMAAFAEKRKPVFRHR